MRYLLLIYGEDDDWAATATTVRVRGGATVVEDGPAASSPRELGGYRLIDADSLDDAISLAERIPEARSGAIEIRPADTAPGRRA